MERIKRYKKKLGSFLRGKVWKIPVWTIVAVIALTGVAGAAYRIISITAGITTTEAISASPESFTVGPDFYPNETHVETVTVTNIGSVAIDVTVTWSLVPDDGGLVVTFTGLTPANIIVVPGSGSDTYDIEIVAASDIDPAVSYTIEIHHDR